MNLMKINNISVSIAVAIFLAAGAARAGRLHESLPDIIKQKGADQSIRVWIRMAEDQNAADFKREISAAPDPQAKLDELVADYR